MRAPDGYTLLYSSSAISTTPYIYKKAAFDVLRDFAPIATVGILDGYLMLVNPSLPIHSVPGPHRLCEGQPCALWLARRRQSAAHHQPSCSTSRPGSSWSTCRIAARPRCSTRCCRAASRSTFLTPATTVALVKEGKLRAIGFTGRKPFPELPDVPLVSASVPNYPPSSSWGIFFAPAKTPAAIVDKLNAAIRHALTVPAVANVVQKSGYIPDGRTAAQTAEFFRQEVEAAGEAVQGRRHPAELAHVPEKWVPVFRKGHAPTKRNKRRVIMPYADIRGVAINYEILGNSGPAMALSPGGRNPLSARDADRRADGGAGLPRAVARPAQLRRLRRVVRPVALGIRGVGRRPQ